MYESKSYSSSDVEKKWLLVDLNEQTLGRAASEIAQILRGKRKPQYTPHSDTGDFVVAINAAKIKVTGAKEQQKMYYKHTGYIGGMKERNFEDMRAKNPDDIIYQAVKGMLPKTKLGRNLLKKLKVYPLDQHPHAAQKLEPIQL